MSRQKREIFNDTLHVGQRVRSSLPHLGQGTIVAVHGEQSPETCNTSRSRIGTYGGCAKVDIAFDNGVFTTGLEESIVRASLQWAVLPEIVSTSQVELARRRCEARKAEKERAQEAAKNQFEAELDTLRNDPELSKLTPCAGTGDESKTGAANIRKLLRRAYPETRFSVRKSNSAIRISWEDGPAEEAVSAIADRFKLGAFDSMDDCYHYRRTPWATLFGGSEYVVTERTFSDALFSQAIDSLWQRYAGNLEGVQKPTPDNVRHGAVNFRIPGLTDYIPTAIRKEAAALAG